MTHLDEGTIHAWLDGGLDAGRAREAEAHARECETCAAAVAEARGLIAASSRILSALDDVPGNVIPAALNRGSALARPRGRRTMASFAKRMLRAAPWVTGIAAVLLAAIVLRTTRDTPDFARESAKMDEAQRTAQLTLDSMRPRQTESRPGLSPVSAPATVLPSRSNSASGAGALASSQPQRVTARETQLAEASAAQAEVRPAPAAGTAADRAARVASERAADDEMRRRDALAPAPTLDRVIAASVAERLIPLDSLPPADFAGCYQVPRAREDAISASVGAVAARKTRAAGVPGVAAPPVADYAAANPGIFIRLDTLRGRPGFIARSAMSDSLRGWWRRVSRDSARVDLFMAGVFTVTPARRVPCPGDVR